MKHKCFTVCTVFLMLFLISAEVAGQRRVPLPKQGIVPDEMTAVKIAEAVFPPVFGENQVAKFVPYHARFEDGVWIVYGTLKKGSMGGTPMLRIQKKDAKILEVWHSQ